MKSLLIIWDYRSIQNGKTRITKYNKGKPYHKAWLQEIVNMNPLNLNKNTIGLSAAEIKSMAKDLLEKNIFL